MRPEQPAAQVLGHEIRVLRRDEIGEPAVDQIDAIDADETRELAVGVEDDVAVHEHRFVDAFTELGEEFRAGLLASRGTRRAQQQLVHGQPERLDVELGFVFGVDVDVMRQALAGHGALNSQRQLGDRPQIAPLEQEQHEKQRRHECEQHAYQPEYRHPEAESWCY